MRTLPPGPPFEQEGHRTIGVAHRIGDEGDLGLQAAALGIVERDRSGGRLETKRAARQLDGVFGGRIGRKPQWRFRSAGLG